MKEIVLYLIFGLVFVSCGNNEKEKINDYYRYFDRNDHLLHLEGKGSLENMTIKVFYTEEDGGATPIFEKDNYAYYIASDGSIGIKSQYSSSSEIHKIIEPNQISEYLRYDNWGKFEQSSIQYFDSVKNEYKYLTRAINRMDTLEFRVKELVNPNPYKPNTPIDTMEISYGKNDVFVAHKEVDGRTFGEWFVYDGYDRLACYVYTIPDERTSWERYKYDENGILVQIEILTGMSDDDLKSEIISIEHLKFDYNKNWTEARFYSDKTKKHWRVHRSIEYR